VSDLRGAGIEVGAGANPMPLPFSCSVRFVDFYDKSGLEENSYDGQHLNDIVRPDIVGTFEDLSGVQDDSLDFVVACHVIEHTRDPIGAIYNSYRKLRKGGTIALVIPDMTRTFDRDRERTQLSHLIDDFRAPDRERDAAHFREFYSVGLPVKPAEFEQHWRQKWTEAYPIHYHTWTYESFKEMIGWIDANVCKFERIWSQTAITGQADCIEFYCSMTK
jgi:SAM-dependent methyltransferase